MTLRKITESDLYGKGVVGMEDVPGLSALEMQRKVEEVVRDVVIPVINENADKTVSKRELGEAIIAAGAGDMTTYLYDKNHDGRVDEAENGFSLYTHTVTDGIHFLEGAGENIKFIASADWSPNSRLFINGKEAVPTDADNISVAEGELFKSGALITCFAYTGGDGTLRCFFKSGGAGANYTVKGGTSCPASPVENTVWLCTDTEIKQHIISIYTPESRADGSDLQTGDVWLVSGLDGSIRMNAVRKNRVEIVIIAAYQWIDGQWENKTVKGYTDGRWHDSEVYIFSASHGINRGQWSGANGNITVSESGIRLVPSSYSYGTAVCNRGVDVTSFNKVIFSISEMNRSSSDSTYNYVGVAPTVDTAFGDAHFSACTRMYTATTGDVYVDISALTGIHYPKFQSHCYNNGFSSIVVNKITFTY